MQRLRRGNLNANDNKGEMTHVIKRSPNLI
jgi:hypothetical protein